MATQQPFDFNTAVSLARDARKRRKYGDLNDRGKSLLADLESELRRRGYRSFSDYEKRESERVGRNEELRRSVVAGREKSEALGIEAQAETESIEDRDSLQKQATRAGRAADRAEGILFRRAATGAGGRVGKDTRLLAPEQGMPTTTAAAPSASQERPGIGRRIGQGVGTAADVVYRQTLGRFPAAERYLETPTGKQGGNLAAALALATGQRTRFNYETGEVTDEQGNPLRAPTRGNVLQAITGAVLAEPGRAVSGVRGVPAPPGALQTRIAGALPERISSVPSANLAATPMPGGPVPPPPTRPQLALPAPGAIPMPGLGGFHPPGAPPRSPGMMLEEQARRRTPPQRFSRMVMGEPQPVPPFGGTPPMRRVEQPPQSPPPITVSSRQAIRRQVQTGEATTPAPAVASPPETINTPRPAPLPIGGGASPQNVSQLSNYSTVVGRVFGKDWGERMIQAGGRERQLIGSRTARLRELICGP